VTPSGSANLGFIPKCRGKRSFGQIRQHVGEVFHNLAAHKESPILVQPSLGHQQVAHPLSTVQEAVRIVVP
jgi:hypothetical protein